MNVDIYHTDYLEFLKHITDKSYNAVISDPPYDGEVNMAELRRVCTGHIIMFCKPLHPFFAPDKLDYWIKTPSTKNTRKRTSEFVEWITFEFHGDVFNPELHWSNYTGVYTDCLLTKPAHPFEKPLSLMERLVMIYTNPGDVIFDPFCGSGTTLKAADNCGRAQWGARSLRSILN